MTKNLLWLLIVLVGMASICAFAQEAQIPVPQGAVGRLGMGLILDVKYSPDGKHLVVATSLGIELWDAKTLELVRFFQGHTGYVYSVAFSPDGKTLASSSYDKMIKLWDVSTGNVIRTLIGHVDPVRSVAFSPDGKMLASGSADKTIKLWDVGTGSLMRTLTGHADSVNSVAFSPDGKMLASGSADKTIKLWDVSTGNIIRTLTGHTGYVYSVVFSPDGKTLASSSYDKMIKLWDVSTGNIIRTLTGHMGVVWSVTFSPDGKTLASGSYDNMVKLWDVSTGNIIRTITGHAGSVTSVTFSPDGKTLASGSYDNTIELWDVATGTLQRTLTGHTSWVNSVAFSPDGRTLASGSLDHTIKLWDVATGTLQRTLTGHADSVNSVAFSPNGKMLASGSADKTIKLWDVGTGSLMRTLTGHADSVNSVAFSPNGKMLASGSADKTIKLWDVGTGSLMRTLTGHADSVNSVVFSPDGKMLASGSRDKTIKLWDVSTGNIIRTLTGHTGYVYSVVFSPDGKTLASSSYDKMIKLWDVTSGSLIRTLTGQTGYVESVAFSPDGKTLASGSGDGTVLLWDVNAIIHPNQPPIPRFTTCVLAPTGERKVEVQPRVSDRVWFDASESSDPDGNVVKYEWDWESDGSYDASVTDPVIGHVFTTPGAQHIALQVTDDKGGTAKVTKTITVGTKQQPQASFSFTPTQPTILGTVEFVDLSSDPDGNVASWSWDFGDGSISTKQNPTHAYSEKKTYTIKLTVTDNDGLTDTATKKLTVINLAPTAAFTFSPKSSVVGQPTSFDASSSTDKDGTITDYAWAFGDGSTGTGKTASHTFSKEGSYAITLTVTDDDGATATHEEKITVSATPPGPPKFNDEWGLVIGVQDYEYTKINDLEFTKDDAQAFYNYLIGRGGGGFPKDNVRLLLDQQATQRDMREGFKWLMDNAGKDDLVVVYYAGHGGYGPDYNHDENDGFDEYLLPYDTNPDDFFSTAVRDDEIGDWLASMRSEHVLLVFDSCFSGGATREVRTFSEKGTRAGPGNKVFSDLTADGRLILAASQEDEPSYEDQPLKHGVFTYFLLQAVGGSEDPSKPGETTPQADENGDGRVTVEELQDYLTKRVPKYITEEMHEKPQHPLIEGDEGLKGVAVDGYGIPLSGEVTAIQGETVIISIGSRQGIRPGDQFEVIRPLTLPDGTVMNEVEATIEVLYILGPNRAGCKILKQEFPVQVHDHVRPVNETNGQKTG